MKPALLLLVAIAAAVLPTGPALADVAFPARLTVNETAPGDFEIEFILPIIEGRKLRARPMLPPTCRDLTEREVSVSSAGHSLTWSARCEPASLVGEAVLVEGLLGTQVDLAFTLTTLDGRVYSEILRPSRPGFLVPEPPSLAALAAKAGVAGMRRTLRHLPLWMLLTAAALLGARRRGMVAAAAAFAAAHALGQWLGGNSWLQIAHPQRDLFVLATVAVPAVALAGGGERWHGWLRPLWPVVALTGLLYGGATPEALSPGGLSDVEQLMALGLFAAGVALALLLIALIATELDALLRLGAAEAWRLRATRWLGCVLGAVATGMLLARVVGVALLPPGGRGAPLELALLAAVLAPSLVLAGRGGARTVPSFAALAATGVAAGLLRLPLPLGSTLVVGTLLLLGAPLAVNRPLPGRWVLAVAVVALPAHAWFVAQGLLENVSRSTGVAVGAAVLATCVFYAALEVSRGHAEEARLPVRLLGAGVALLAVAKRLGEYHDWFDRQLATELALGMVRLPVLALLLATVALLVWPRRRRVIEQLGLERRQRTAHWMLLGAAWLALPYGTLALPNPLFEPHAPRGEDARRVALRVLSDTYHAFNLSDEDELYDRLAESVTGDLVDDLYLDSRRRLTAGTREGAQVTVREVDVLEIGEPDDDGGDEPRFAYDCRWMVTARVRHLQHVHHRRNIYNGVLTLSVDGERWKIAGVELHSEDREVLPWKPV